MALLDKYPGIKELSIKFNIPFATSAPVDRLGCSRSHSQEESAKRWYSREFKPTKNIFKAVSK